MNDRIRELYQQAHSIRHYDGDPMREGNPPTVYWQGEKSAEKFAELIVRECLAQVDKVDEMLEDDSEKAGVAWVGYAIEKHFGVEE
jgi:hypothetical protein